MLHGDIYRTDRMEWLGLEGMIGGGANGYYYVDEAYFAGGVNLTLFPFRKGWFYMKPVQVGLLHYAGQYGYMWNMLPIGFTLGGAFNLPGSPEHEFRVGIHVTTALPFTFLPVYSGFEAQYVHNIARHFRVVTGLRFTGWPTAGFASLGFHL